MGQAQVCAGEGFESWAQQTLPCLSPCLHRRAAVPHPWAFHGNQGWQGRHSFAGCVLGWGVTRALLEAPGAPAVALWGTWTLGQLAPLSRRKCDFFGWVSGWKKWKRGCGTRSQQPQTPFRTSLVCFPAVSRLR